MQTHKNEQPVIACNFGAIEPSHRSNHADTAEHIFTSTLEITELADGYAFRLPLESPMLQKAMAWITHERLCCPFFHFTLDIGEQFWLRLSGGDGVKDFIRSTIVDTLRETGQLPDKEAWIAAHTPEEAD
jgi:hypothetical protein